MLGMLGKNKDRSIANLIIARMTPSGNPEKMGEKEDQSDYTSAYDSCCEEIFDSLKNNDKKSFISSLGNMIDMMINEREMKEE